MSITATITLLACVLTCGRLLLFRRAGMRYRWGISLLAWLLIASSGASALDILLHPHAPIGWGTCGMAAVLCLLTFRARGNLAHILRPNHDQHPAPR